MGSPELPNDAGDEDLRCPPVHHPAAASDDSDNESMTEYEGYEPLNMDENQIEYGNVPTMDDDDEGFSNSVQANTLEEEQSEAVEVTHGDPNMPPIESIDAEVEREVWSQPRPQELQIELDTNKTEQILNAMANFTLPNMSVPAWADGVPEERWKEELLQRIRQRKPSANEAQMDVDKETK